MPASSANSDPTASVLPLANTHMNHIVSKQTDAVELFRLIRPAGVNGVLTVLMVAKLARLHARTPVVWDCASMLFTRGGCEYSRPIKV